METNKMDVTEALTHLNKLENDIKVAKSLSDLWVNTSEEENKRFKERYPDGLFVLGDYLISLR